MKWLVPLLALVACLEPCAWPRNPGGLDAHTFDPNELGRGAGLPSQASCSDLSPFGQALMDIGNLHVVAGGSIYRGGEPSAQGIADLAALKIKTLIDLEGGDIHSLNPFYDLYDRIAEPGETNRAIANEKLEAEAKGLHFYNLPLNAYEKVSPAEAETINKILDILHDPANQPAYVHCEHGKDRTGLIMALYAVKYLHESPAQAHAEMVADGHSGIIDQLITRQMDHYFWQMAPTYANPPPSQ